jgi:Ca-activated chloride channel family protein
MNLLIKNIPQAIFLVVIITGFAHPDGIMRPQTTGYPGELLKHIGSEIEANVSGDIVETEVTNSFLNEYHLSVDAVYSFPVPAGAEVTGLWYMRNDIFYSAQLKELPQKTTPGTGEGGFVAELNKYLGEYKVNFPFRQIPAGGVQKIKVRYIQRCSYCNGVFRYRFPLSSAQYRTRFMELVSFTLHINGINDVDSISSTFFPEDMKIIHSGDVTTITINKSKIAADNDIRILWQRPGMNYDACSRIMIEKENTGGYVALSLYPSLVKTTAVFQKNVIFIVDNSTSMGGYAIQQTVAAIKTCLDLLSPSDTFSLISCGNTVTVHYNHLSPGTIEKKQAAETLDSLAKSTVGYSSLQNALSNALSMFPNVNLSNMVIVSTNGNANLRPELLSTNSSASIFPICFGSSAGRERLEYLAETHNGSCLFLDPSSEGQREITEYFKSISVPLVKSLACSWEGAQCHELLPDSRQNALFQGTSLLLVGKFDQKPAKLSFGLSGKSVNSTFTKLFDLTIDSTAYLSSSEIVERMWAKEKIHSLQRKLTVEGYSDTLRKQIVLLSLSYGIRSKYTSYWENDSVQVTNSDKDRPTSMAIDNYKTKQQISTFRIAGNGIEFCAMSSSPKSSPFKIVVLDIMGRLVFEATITRYSSGIIQIPFNFKNNNSKLTKGYYIALIKCGESIEKHPFTIY